MPYLIIIFLSLLTPPQDIFVEAESFQDKGGWKTDPQFVHIMGSPYLLAHGMGTPVKNARTKITFHDLGKYTLWVRTKNWIPGKWEAPGRFQVIVNNQTVDKVFGTEPGWGWRNGGQVDITVPETTLELKDLTGFDGRCDALFFTKDSNATPPKRLEEKEPSSKRAYDLVIVGGGVAGCAAALAADKQGLKTALIHDRPVLGGNASSEVRVHTLGIYGKGEEILKGIDTKHWPNGAKEAIPDTQKRHQTMDQAKNVSQFLLWRAYGVNMAGQAIQSVDAKHVETGETKRFLAPIFIDCTGDGWIGYWAGAEFRYGRESLEEFGESWDKHGERWSPRKGDSLTMGASLLWNSKTVKDPTSFPAVPWAMDVAKDHKALAGEWYWEFASSDKHQIHDAEEIRDHLLRAIYGSFYNAKKDPKNANRVLEWVGYIAGKRESRRLMGDYIYTQKDALSNLEFKDTVVEETREIDVHFQKEENGFLSKALFRKTGGTYYIPFRCLYSKNIQNLMMAGRCFSCSHIGLGGPRVMRTTGQMGIAVGYAAYLCKKHNTAPRGVQQNHIQELRQLIGYEK